jgi:hypothetical protein
MPLTIDQLADRVWDKMQHEVDNYDRPCRGFVIDSLRIAIKEMGFHLNIHDEICDPRPAPSMVPQQQNVRWRGGKRRR